MLLVGFKSAAAVQVQECALMKRQTLMPAEIACQPIHYDASQTTILLSTFLSLHITSEQTCSGNSHITPMNPSITYLDIVMLPQHYSFLAETELNDIYFRCLVGTDIPKLLRELM